MNLPEAIEVLKWLDGTGTIKTTKQCHDGLRLGFEALKREQYHRSCYPNQIPNLLPGETP